MTYDAVIIGGGAAGLFCAIEAGKRGRRVLVIEHNAEVGRKIIISGGGRCNFTNTSALADNFISRNPHFCKSALSRYTPQDLIGLVKKHKIAFYEKKLGQLFCRDSSRQIVDMLVAEAAAARVKIETLCSVTNVRKNDVFEITTSRGTVQARNLVVACGGLSFPKVGATDLGYEIARQFGLKIVETRPSLVAMVTKADQRTGLAGVSIESEVVAGDQAFRENILFTHRGLSGPAILQISNYWQRGQAVTIDLLPDLDIAQLINKSGTDTRPLVNLIADHLPLRAARSLVAPKYAGRLLKKLSPHEVDEIASDLNRRQVQFTETEGYDRAEVTLGGVSTGELSSKTMESRRVPGLYFIGEVVDVTGWLGGYNFQWAWSSGFAAGNAIA